MSTAGHTPNFVAEEDIYPFRCVMVGSAPFKAVTASSDPEILLGVTDGSVQGFNSVYNASAGQLISMQNGEFVQLTAGGTISVGDTLIASTDGKVVASTTATEYIAQAAEGANDGEVFWAKKIGAWTVHGGGGGGGGTLTVDVQEFDDPEAVNTWVKPAGAMRVYVQLCGAGQDGGDSGFPMGGNGGTVADKWMNAADLPSTVAVTLGVHQPWATASDDGTSAFGTYLSAGIAGAYGVNGSDSGGSTIEICGFNMAVVYRYGQGAVEDMLLGSGNAGFAFGPSGGGGAVYWATGYGYDGSGGKPSTNAVALKDGQMVVLAGGGAAGGSTGAQGGNGGNGSIDPVTGFGGGGGGGGTSTNASNFGGNGGNGIRGGGGGGAGFNTTVSGNYGLPGAGGDGYVRVSTLCYA